MLATGGRDRDLTSGGWRFEPKLDGWRALVTVDGKVTVRRARVGTSPNRCPSWPVSPTRSLVEWRRSTVS
jgi:hypothetical protein